MSTTRRNFMETTLAAASAYASQTPASQQPPVTIGLIGAGIRGMFLLKTAIDAGAKVAIACDLYDGHLRRVQEIQPNTPTTRKFEEVLARPDIQAVAIATSDHWHAPLAIAAMKAGKDVYLEKPMTHTIPEVLEIMKVSRQTGRLLQIGSQSVSMQTTRKAKEWISAGAIGNIYMVQCSINRPSAQGAWRYPIPPDATPQTVDWDRFLGNAPKRPFDVTRFFHFRNWWDYSTGISGDEFVHLLSRIHHVLDVQYPLSAVSTGGIYKWKGDRDVPDIHNTLYDYGKFQVQMSADLASNWDPEETVRFLGDRGTVELTKPVVRLFPYDPQEEASYPLESWPKDQKERYLAENPRGPRVSERAPETFKQTREGTEDHMRNLFECMRTRQQPVENVDFGAGTAVACHMANTSYREKKRVFWNAEKMELKS